MNSYLNTYSNKNIINNNFPKYETNVIMLNNHINKSLNMLSQFASSKLLCDTSLNKYYKKYIQKQAHIQHQQKLYELIEKLDDAKAFNALKIEYLKEKALLQNIHNKKRENKRVIYASNFVNLKNCEEKLNSIYKLSTQDLDFMTSLMHFLGNRPKKIYKPKINKKLEALSQGKLGFLLKKKEEYSKQESNTNTLYNYNSHNSGHLIKKNPYLKYFLKDPSDNIKDSTTNLGNKNDNQNQNQNQNNNTNYNNNNIMSKTNEDFYKSFSSNSNNNIRRKSIGFDMSNRGYTQRFLGKTKSTNFGLTSYNYFINNTNPNETKYSHYNNNIKTENLITNSESPNDNSNTEDKNMVNSNIYKNYYKTKSKFNSQTSLFSLNNKSRNRSKNSTAKKTTKEAMNTNTNIVTKNQNQSTLENIINQRPSIKNNDENDLNKMIINKDYDDNTDDFSILSNLKKQDKHTIKNKLVKIYKNTMNEFLQKIKDEEKDLYNNSSKLSTLLYKFKKYGSYDKIKNRNKNKQKDFINKNNKNNNLTYNLKDKRSTTTLNLKQNNLNMNKLGNLKNEKVNNIMAKTFYPSWGKSKFSIPYINKIVYGEENSMDVFEQLQKDLFFEVKNEIRKSNIINKKKGKKGISINGKEILNKFRNNNNNDSEFIE